MSDLKYTPRCPVCGTTDRPGMGHACSTIPAIGTGPLDTPFRKCAGCDQLKAELAALKSDYANRGTEIEWFRRELAAANAGVERLRGFVEDWREEGKFLRGPRDDTADRMAGAVYLECARKLDAVLKENNDD